MTLHVRYRENSRDFSQETPGNAEKKTKGSCGEPNEHYTAA
jgi:hypothetical protein